MFKERVLNIDDNLKSKALGTFNRPIPLEDSFYPHPPPPSQVETGRGVEGLRREKT
ncbi:MAG: hypothetical protein ACUZ8I_16965 [Candidatus Scalindua sp.]